MAPNTAPLLMLKNGAFRRALLVHPAAALVALGDGPFQFSTRLRTRRPMAHRLLGYLYFVSVSAGGKAALFSATGRGASKARFLPISGGESEAELRT